VLPLKVGGPFHSVYMRPAADALSAALAQTTLRHAAVPVVVNATAQAVREPDALRLELATQIYSTVRWIETLECLAALGCDRFLEVGPGQVLAGLVRRTLPDTRVASFGQLADLPAARALLADAAA
jgi:[acyl-carrier-protein] S-malonyltransferase